jgi:hypothetical protein
LKSVGRYFWKNFPYHPILFELNTVVVITGGENLAEIMGLFST